VEVTNDAVKQPVAAHWDRRAAHFDEDFGHSIRTLAGSRARSVPWTVKSNTTR